MYSNVYFIQTCIIKKKVSSSRVILLPTSLTIQLLTALSPSTHPLSDKHHETTTNFHSYCFYVLIIKELFGEDISTFESIHAVSLSRLCAASDKGTLLFVLSTLELTHQLSATFCIVIKSIKYLIKDNTSRNIHFKSHLPLHFQCSWKSSIAFEKV